MVKARVMKYIHRLIEDKLLTAIQQTPVTALIGPRQCGKSTLAKKIAKKFTISTIVELH